MALKVILVLVVLVSECWTAPWRRNWTPQAMLYLKGAQGHRSVLERGSREDADTLHLVNHNQISDGRGVSLASVILSELLQHTVEEGGGQSDNHLN